MEHPHCATAASAALAVPAERAAIAALAALAAVVLLGRAAAVVLVLRAPAALAAVVAPAGPAGMRVVSPMARLVVMLARVAVVAWVELRAHRARTPHRWSVALAAAAATRARRVPARRVSAA
jgi:hypothetical protein